MKIDNTRPLKDVIQEYLKTLGLDQKLKEYRLIHAWGELLGKSVKNSTGNVYIKNKILFVQLNSSVIKNELLMLKQGIIKALNDRINSTVINDIVFF